MADKLPNSLKEEINKFLEGFIIKELELSEKGVELVREHYQKLKDEDRDLFAIKFHLAEAIRINNK